MPLQRTKYRRSQPLVFLLALLIFSLLQGSTEASRVVSRYPGKTKDKAKIDVMQAYTGAKLANGTPILPDTETGECPVGISAGGDCKVHPQIAVYLQEEPEFVNSPRDVYVGVSLDDGGTWKRTNLSGSARRTTKANLGDGVMLEGYHGDTVKPMLKVKGKYALVAWTGKFCVSGDPGRLQDSGSPDKYQVMGSQRAKDYGSSSKGQVPYSCVWSARGFIDSSSGEVVWFKAQQLTTGRRDANQLFVTALGGAGFAMVWQEDPRGLKPGEAAGPGEGWSGATVNRKTDIWYSYIKANSGFAAIDESPTPRDNEWEEGAENLTDEYGPKGDRSDPNPDPDPEGEGEGGGEGGNRPFAMNRFSPPIRISANAPCRWVESYDDWKNDHDHEDAESEGGSEDHGPTITGPTFLGGDYCDDLCWDSGTPRLSIRNSKNRTYCVTEQGLVLDGTRGASRAVVALQPAETAGEAVVMIAWEESKGLGMKGSKADGHGERRLSTDADGGQPDEPPNADADDIGKNVKYVQFNSNSPQAISSGMIMNLPQLDSDGQPLLNEDKTAILTYNARRVKLITQPKKKMGLKGNAAVVAIWREGDLGHGHPADIMMRVARNGYTPTHFDRSFPKSVTLMGPTGEWKSAEDIYTKGVINLSSPRVKCMEEKITNGTVSQVVTEWTFPQETADDSPVENPFDDARAHRAVLRGDTLVVGYTWTPNWGRGVSNYQFYLWRAFDGAASSGNSDGGNNGAVPAGVRNTNWAGHKEPPKCLSCGLQGNITGNAHDNSIGRGVMEPRLISTPGTIYNSDKTTVATKDDVQNEMVYFVAFARIASNGGTSGRYLSDSGYTGEKDVSEGLLWTWTDNFGETWQPIGSPGPSANESSVMSGYKLADSKNVLESGAQLRTNPAGTKVFAAFVGNTKDEPENDGNVGPCGMGGGSGGESLATDAGGGDSVTGAGSSVCSRSSPIIDPFASYKMGYDDFGDMDCKKDLKPCNSQDDCEEGTADLNGDGKVNNDDKRLCEEAFEQYLEQLALLGGAGTRDLTTYNPANNRGRLHKPSLRGNIFKGH